MSRRITSARSVVRIAYLAFGLATTAGAALAADEDTPSPMEDVIVTGTREKTRTAAQSLAPIDVISADELTKSGKQSTRDLISTVVPSIDTSNSGAGASFAIKTVALRGLSGDETLVLVNGKRRHDTSVLFINGTTQNGQTPPDLDLIPVSSIDHVEVLLDGASAQYGSDAIAGVINIILKSTTPGVNIPLLYGQTGGGDGKTGQFSPDMGLTFDNGGYLHLSADGRLQGRTERGTPNKSVLYFPVNGQPDPREATANRNVNHPGQPEVKSGELSYDLGIPLAHGTTFYSFSTGAVRNSDSWLTYRNPDSALNNQAVFPNGYSPNLSLHEVDYQGVAGIKGSGFLGLSWDFSSSYGSDAVGFYEPTSLNASLGPASPSSFYIGKLASTEWTSNLDVNRHFDTSLFADPLFAAGGVEYRQNRYSIGAGDTASYINGGYVAPSGPLKGVATTPGSEGVTGFPPTDAGTFSRSDYAIYLNFEQRLARTWEVDLAGRYEDYSDAGSATTGKLSTRFEPVPGFALRGTISNGFRAPTLAQEHYASSSTIGVQLTPTTPSVLYPVSALPVNSPAAIALGARPLVPEKSLNYSAGFVLQPAEHLDFTLDAYQIKITDRILLTGTLVGSAVSSVFSAAGLSPNQGGFFFTNGADTTTRGADFVSTYRSNFGPAGLVSWSFSANYNKTQFDRIEAPPPVLAAAGLVLITRQRQGDFTVGTPRDKEIFDADWALGSFDTNLRVTRYGEVTDTGTTPKLDDTITPKVIVDLSVDYTVSHRLTLTVGANNLFNVYPNVLSLLNQGNTGFNYYNPYSPFGFNGGFYYARVALHF
jgi:iron complex outermembrane recepter protein